MAAPKDCDTPVVGMACTVCWVTDRSAATVIAVSRTGAKVTVREDRATRTDTNGMSECQDYTYEPDPNGTQLTFYRRGNGSYGMGGMRLVLGHRRSYHDYSF